MSRIDWNRTRIGWDGYDADLAREWASGPRTGDFERPDGADTLKLNRSPTIYWAAELARAFPEDCDQGHLDLFTAARKAAANAFFAKDWATARSRVLAIHARSSSMRIYPSAYYAVYFDHAAMVFARGDSLNRTGSISRRLDEFSSRIARWQRALPMLRVYEKKHGVTERKVPMHFNEWLSVLWHDSQ